eukprot:4603213-Lingulodinium_polyedra.AAC.1
MFWRCPLALSAPRQHPPLLSKLCVRGVLNASVLVMRQQFVIRMQGRGEGCSKRHAQEQDDSEQRLHALVLMGLQGQARGMVSSL